MYAIGRAEPPTRRPHALLAAAAARNSHHCCRRHAPATRHRTTCVRSLSTPRASARTCALAPTPAPSSRSTLVATACSPPPAPVDPELCVVVSLTDTPAYPAPYVGVGRPPQALRKTVVYPQSRGMSRAWRMCSTSTPKSPSECPVSVR